MPPARESEAAVRWLRISYRAGALVDALAAIGMIFPARLWSARFRGGFRRDSYEFAYGMRAGAPLMAGWTVLLLWADQRPLERKQVLPITIAPVILGLMANDAHAARTGKVARLSLAPTRALQLALIALFSFSYVNAATAGSRASGSGCA